MDPDTDIGGAQQRFPVTNQSAIAAARSEDQVVRQRAFNTILANYWKPAYKYIRLKWQANNEEAKDLTQGFFANAFEKKRVVNQPSTFTRRCSTGSFRSGSSFSPQEAQKTQRHKI